MIKKKYTKDQIESLVKKQVKYWKWDKTEGVYVNCWTVVGHGTWGFGNYKPQFASKQEAQKAFREHLIKHFLNEKEEDFPTVNYASFARLIVDAGTKLLEDNIKNGCKG